MPTNIGDNRIIERNIARITEDDANRLKQHRLKMGDIVYSRRGDVEKRSLIREREVGWICGTGCLKVRLGNGVVDPLFASLFLGHPAIKEWIVRNAVGAHMPNLNTTIMGEVPFSLPPLAEQKTISGMLGALEDQIEITRRINEELEGMAKLLYDYWFVQFDFPITSAQAAAMRKPHLEGKPYRTSGGKMAYDDALKREIPDGWEGGNILAIADLGGGATPRKKEPKFWGGEIPFFTPTDAESNPFCLDTKDHITQLGLGMRISAKSITVTVEADHPVGPSRSGRSDAGLFLV
jgi:type I restriction enzyme S subunit